MKKNWIARVAIAVLASSLVGLLGLGSPGVPSHDGGSLVIESLDPVNNQVRVVIANNSSAPQGGLLHLQVSMNGRTAKAVQQLNVPAKSQVSTHFTFDAKVTSIVWVGIIEDPDPIP